MAASLPIEDSLLQLLQCNVCGDHQRQLKALPCQHTICIECAKKLTVKQNRFMCHVCNEEMPVPNGGLERLPDSLITKQIARILRQDRKSAESGDDRKNDPQKALRNSLPSSDSPLNALISASGGFGFVPSSSKKANAGQPAEQKTTRGKTNSSRRKQQKPKREDLTEGVQKSKVVQPAELVNLRDDLQKALESGKRWYKKSDEMMDYYSKVLVILPNHAQHTRELIIAYQEKIVRLCQEKLKGLNRGLCDRTTELEESLIKIQPKADKMRDAMRTVPEIVKKLSSTGCSPKSVADAQQSLLELTALNKTVNREGHAIDNYGQITSGDPVRLRILNENSEEENLEDLVNGKVSFSSIGIFRGELIEKIPNPLCPWLPMERRRPMAIFPEQHDWIGKQGSLVKCTTKSNLPYIGDRVRVKASVTAPHFSWNGVRGKKSRGILREIQHDGPTNDLIIVVEFSEDKEWMGLYSEIELAPGCGLEVGDLVWVSRSIPEPSRGWGGVNGSSVGVVKGITGGKGQEEVIVDFPECKDWIGLATELELVRKPQKGDRVQVKLSVGEPLKGWNGITHDDVGVLVDLDAGDYEDYYDEESNGDIVIVRFPKRQTWKCSAADIEPIRYEPPSYAGDVADSEGEDEGAIIFRNLLLANMFGGMFE